MNFSNLAWWACFIFVGVWLQQVLPGVDVLVAGLLVSLQERRHYQTFWLLLVLLLVQEGAGTLAFGSTVLWYGVLLVFFNVGRWLFEAENLAFVVLISLGLGVCHFLFTLMMASLQQLDIPRDRLLLESVWQACVVPPAWWLTHFVRRRCMGDAHPV
ncbi:hypothetical protein [Nitratidesulfovibrio sp. SRB-5]|uniref:hypothetical protein n=1 Tax=Nitratidesulfovibrio sp. SRB-5 TaxID=2872636 RepID=UPI0010268DB7|nr:hypothetical protein [Nitratidesulfovibrio sp. SRB-5]MBZ2170994.1 hypothetical protein [Nitratidesulfovibrio sp. SRB-5]RXF77011.1 hypothetical protein EKK70_08670 [Desulfovibrio sp. DS-1]